MRQGIHIASYVYRYFMNKDNIIRWKMKQLFEVGILQIGRIYTWYQGLRITIAGIYKYRSIFTDEQTPDITDSFKNYGANLVDDAFVETLTRYKGVALTHKLSFQIEALGVAQGHMMRKWAEEDMETPSDEMASLLESIVPKDLYILLNEPNTHIA